MNVNTNTINIGLYTGELEAFARFLSDGGIYSPDVYLSRENEDFSYPEIIECDFESELNPDPKLDVIA